MKKSLVAVVLIFTTGLLLFAEGQSDASAAAKARPKIVFMRSSGNNPYAIDVKEDDRYFKAVSELSGYDFSFIYLDHANYHQLLSLRFASGDLPEVILTDSVDSQYHAGALDNGAFVDLTDLIPKYAPNMQAQVPAEYWKNPNVSKDGRIYGIPWLTALPTARVVYYRKDWLEKAGMESLVTIDDYLAFFEKIKSMDLDGNGMADEIPFGVRTNFGYSELFFGYFGVYPGAWQDRNGTLLPDIIQPEMLEALEFWKMLYEKGYVNSDMFIRSGSDWMNEIYANKIGLWNHDAQNLTTSWAPGKFSEDAVIDCLPGPLDKNGNLRLIPRSTGFSGVWVVNAQVKDPSKVLEFFNWLYSDDIEKEKLFTFGIEGYNYTEADGEIVYDPTIPANSEKNTSSFLQVQLNPKGDNRMNPLLIDQYPWADLIRKAIKTADECNYMTEGHSMPVLQAFKENPDLGKGSGSLFMDMAAKVITGNADAQTAFDSFVSEWKRRGGDQAIEEAAEWYKSQR